MQVRQSLNMLIIAIAMFITIVIVVGLSGSCAYAKVVIADDFTDEQAYHAPSTLKIKSVKVKNGKNWKKLAPKYKNKSIKCKVSWNKRNDVDGYYIYEIKSVIIPKSKLNSRNYHYVTSLENTIFYGPSKKDFVKPVKTLPASASSYTFTIKGSKYPSYAIVPFVRYKGDIIVGEANRWIEASYTSPEQQYYKKNGRHYTVIAFTKNYYVNWDKKIYCKLTPKKYKNMKKKGFAGRYIGAVLRSDFEDWCYFLKYDDEVYDIKKNGL